MNASGMNMRTHRSRLLRWRTLSGLKMASVGKQPQLSALAVFAFLNCASKSRETRCELSGDAGFGVAIGMAESIPLIFLENVARSSSGGGTFGLLCRRAEGRFGLLCRRAEGPFGPICRRASSPEPESCVASTLTVRWPVGGAGLDSGGARTAASSMN